MSTGVHSLVVLSVAASFQRELYIRPNLWHWQTLWLKYHQSKNNFQLERDVLLNMRVPADVITVSPYQVSMLDYGDDHQH